MAASRPRPAVPWHSSEAAGCGRPPLATAGCWWVADAYDWLRPPMQAGYGGLPPAEAGCGWLRRATAGRCGLWPAVGWFAPASVGHGRLLLATVGHG